MSSLRKSQTFLCPVYLVTSESHFSGVFLAFSPIIVEGARDPQTVLCHSVNEWWRHSNPTCCNQICLNCLHS